MKVALAAVKLVNSEIRSQICCQPCENSGQLQMIHSEHDSHFSVGLFGTEQLLTTSFWRRLQKNDAMEVASEKEGFLMALTKTRSKWLKIRLVQLLLKRVHPKLCSPF